MQIELSYKPPPLGKWGENDIHGMDTDKPRLGEQITDKVFLWLPNRCGPALHTSTWKVAN